jgi:hypothetical protein
VSLNGIPTGIHARGKRSLERIRGALLLGLRLALGLLLGLGRLLSRLLLSLRLGRPLLPSAGDCAHGGANGRSFSGIAGYRAYRSASRGASRSTLDSSTLAHVLLGLLRRLLLGGLLLLRTWTCSRRSLWIDTRVLPCRTIAIALVLELLVGILLVPGISEHADTLRGGPRGRSLGCGTRDRPSDRQKH